MVFHPTCTLAKATEVQASLAIWNVDQDSFKRYHPSLENCTMCPSRSLYLFSLTSNSEDSCYLGMLNEIKIENRGDPVT